MSNQGLSAGCAALTQEAVFAEIFTGSAHVLDLGPVFFHSFQNIVAKVATSGEGINDQDRNGFSALRGQGRCARLLAAGAFQVTGKSMPGGEGSEAVFTVKCGGWIEGMNGSVMCNREVSSEIGKSPTCDMTMWAQ